MNVIGRLGEGNSWVWATAIGIALGISYMVSPLSVWFVALAVGLFVWVGRGLSDRERRYVWGILAVALAIRVLAIAVLFLSTDNGQLTSFFWDGDGIFIKNRAIVIRDVWMGVPVSAVDLSNAFMASYGWSGFIYVLAYLQYLTGPAPYAVHLLNVLLFVWAAAILFRLIRVSYGRAPAMAGWVLMLFLPTLIAWSVSALKESVCVFLFVVALRAAVLAVRGPRVHHRMLGLVVLSAAMAAASPVRTGAAAIMIVGIGGGLAVTLIVRRAALIFVTLMCLPLTAVSLWQHPNIQARIMAQLDEAAYYHRAAFLTAGDSYAVLDERLYRYPSLTEGHIKLTPGEAGRFVSRAVASFVALPLPGQMSPRLSPVMLPQQMVWYMLVPLAFVGFVVGLRRDALLTCLLAGLALSGSVVLALNNGNVGTMVRFRDWIVPFVVWLSALGATWTVVRFMSVSKHHPATNGQQAAGGGPFAGGDELVSN